MTGLYNDMYNEPVAGIVFLFLSAFWVGAVLSLVNYILTSIGLYTIAKRRGISNPFLAWIPIISCWTVGGIAEEYDQKRSIKRNWKLAILTPKMIVALSIVSMIASCITLAMQNVFSASDILLSSGIIFFYISYTILVMSGVVASIVSYVCYFKIFESTKTEKALLYLILSMLIPMAMGICLFSCRNKGYSNEQPAMSENYYTGYVPPMQ